MVVICFWKEIDEHIRMKLWTEARLLDFLSRLSQPSTSSAPLPPYSNYWNRRSIRFWPIASPAGEKSLACLGWFFCPDPQRRTEMNCETCQLKELVRYRSYALPRFHHGSLLAFSSLILTNSFSFFFWLFGPQELEPTEIRDVLRCECSDLSFSHPLSSLYLRWKGSFITSTNCSLLTRHGNPNVLYSFTCF